MKIKTPSQRADLAEGFIQFVGLWDDYLNYLSEDQEDDIQLIPIRTGSKRIRRTA